MLSSVYKFIEMGFTWRKRLWPSVSKELRWVEALLPLCHADLRIRDSTHVYCGDSSREQGGTEGGYSVCRNSWEAEKVSRHNAWAARWRFKHLLPGETVDPRRRALEQDVTVSSEKECGSPPMDIYAEAIRVSVFVSDLDVRH